MWEDRDRDGEKQIDTDRQMDRHTNTVRQARIDRQKDPGRQTDKTSHRLLTNTHNRRATAKQFL